MVKVAAKKDTLGFTKDRLKDAQAKMRGSSKAKIDEKAQVPYPAISEPALVHPRNNSIVKLRDSGVVDVFANTDTGIRINPNAKTIDMFTQTINHHTSFIRSFVKRDEVHKVGGFWTIECATANVTAKGSINFKAGGNINFKAKGKINFD